MLAFNKRGQWLPLLLLSFLTCHTFGQNAPVSESANSMVDLNTGDFHYSLPVMTVPGPNGESVPISISYQGGIKMDDQASWVGLGWDYNPGEISHNVKGVSDDWKGKSVTSVKTSTNQTTDATNMYGPLYYANYTGSSTSSMDVSSSGYKSSGQFNFPDYDSYHVSGPGISGTMEARTFDPSYLKLKDISGQYTSNGTSTFSLPVNFVFTTDLNGWVLPPNGTPNASYYSATIHRQLTSSYIETFTNHQIDDVTLYPGIKTDGFLDFRLLPGSGSRRPSGNFDPDGIGAFQITDPNGLVYHYSLPVYMLTGEKSSIFILNSSYDIDATKELTQTTKDSPYAVSWKLTAVTGPDYSDVNGNGIADIGDSGYWVAYNYGEWCDNYRWKSPFFNFSANTFSYRDPRGYAYPNTVQPVIENQGIVSTGQIQIYYLNNIQTSTHTAFFIKDIRLDGHSVNETGSGKAPLLRLNKIILVKNEDLGLFTNSATLTFPTGLSFTNCFAINVQPHIGNVLANESLIKAASLSTVEFSYNYSLCKMAYNNNNNTFNPTTTSYSRYTYVGSTNTFVTYPIYDKYNDSTATASTTDLSNSGKLTLTEVKVYGNNYKSATPSYQFDYDQATSAKNPNYCPFKTDYWGYFKKDYFFSSRYRYTTEGSSGSNIDVDAWSLKKITTPLGGEIAMTYESDNYEKVNNGGGYVNPKRIFLVSGHNSSLTSLSVPSEIGKFTSLATILRKTAYLPTRVSGCSGIITFFGDNLSTFTPLSLSAGTVSGNIQAMNISFGYASPSNPCVFTSAATYDPLANGFGYIAYEFSVVSGGGTRVKQISFKDTESNLSYVNEYYYSGGSAGTEPASVKVISEVEPTVNNLSNDPLVPSSYVTYGKVTSKSKSLNGTYLGKTEYVFNNLYEPFNVAFTRTQDPTEATIDAAYAANNTSTLPVYIHYTDSYSVTETKGLFNAPLSTTVYDHNDNIISKNVYEYETGPSVSDWYSLSYSIPFVGGWPGSTTLTYSGPHWRTQVKARLKKTTTYKDGITIINENLEWDPITGDVTKSRVLDPTSGVEETTIIPAYTNSSYLYMGPKSKDPTNNKNILNAPLKVTVTKDRLARNAYNVLVPGGSPQLIDGVKSTYQTSTFQKRVYNNSTSKYETQSTGTSLWEPYQTYRFNGNTTDTYWKYEGENTIYNKRNIPIESKNGNDRYSSIKLGYDQQRTLCKATNAKYADIAFSGFEDIETVATGVTHFGGEVTHGEMRYAGDATIKSHTGKFMAKVDPGYGPGYYSNGFTKGRSYRASVWVHKNSPSTSCLTATLDGSVFGSAYQVTKSIALSDASNITVDDWILMTLIIDVPADYVESGGTLNDLRVYCNNPGSTTAYFDDLLIRPVDISLTGNVTDEKTGQLQAELDNYDFATKYIYDDAGRIHEIWIETGADGWKLKKRYSYNFKRTY